MRIRCIRPAALSLIFICLSSSALGQVVSAKRIDARPSGHPLDTGSPFDPIMDDALRRTFGTSASSATGASVIRVPDWIPDGEKTHPGAKYYMYYSGHHGTKIKMAWSASITGQWHIFNDGTAPDRAWGEKGDYSGSQTPGVGVLDWAHHGLELYVDANTCIDGKIHFVDMYVDDVNQRIIMYLHNVGRTSNGVATSKYGLNFNMPDFAGEKGHGVRNVKVTEWYLRCFEVEGEASGRKVNGRFGVGRGGFWMAPLFTSAGEAATHGNADEPGGWWTPGWPGDPTPEDPTQKWSTRKWWTKLEGDANPLTGLIGPPELFNPERSFQLKQKRAKSHWGRHFAFYHCPVRDRDKIYVFKTNPRELPESVNVVILDLTGLSETERLDPSKWKKVHEVEQVLVKPQVYWEGIDRAYKPSNNGVGNGYQLRDPYVFEDTDGKLYLFYSGKGEANVGVAELSISSEPEERSIRVTAPHGNHPVLVGNVYPIGWLSYGAVAKVDLEYTVSGRDWISIANGVENTHYYAWTVPDAVSHTAKVRVRETGGTAAAESETFEITADKALGIISPKSGTVYVAGKVHYPAYWSTGDMKLITFEYSLDGGEWIEITENHPDTSQKRAQWNAPAFAWEVPETESESVRLRVSDTGGTASVISEPFSILAEE